MVACDEDGVDCSIARERATAAWATYMEEALERSQTALRARDTAARAMALTTMTAGSVRGRAIAESASEDHEAFVSLQVSVGALVAAMLAVHELSLMGDSDGALGLAALVTAELEGDFARLLGPHTADLEATTTLADGSATRLQRLVRDQPQRVRHGVLEMYQALEHRADDGPAEATIDQVRPAFARYLASLEEVRRTQALVDAAEVARRSSAEGSSNMGAAARAVGGDPSSRSQRAALAASEEAQTACAE